MTAPERVDTTSARGIAALGMVLLLGLIVLWHGLLAPPVRMPPWLAMVLHAWVLLPGLVMLALRHRRATFFGALAALVLFCHGVMEAWTSPGVRIPALAEAALSVLVIAGASLDGLRARFAGKRGAV